MGNGLFSKRQLKPSELGYPPERLILPEERIKNEYAALCYIRDNTTIPIPEIESFGRDENDSLKLVTGIVAGKMLEDFDDEERPAVLEAVDQQMERHIFPQPQKLQRDSVGCVDESLPVIAPNCLMYKHRRPFWRRVTSDTPSFVFCHNDLSGFNIILNPDTYEIAAIIDWEYAGFFPAWFDRRLWRERYNKRNWDEVDKYIEDAKDFFDKDAPK
ncbi:hypothetical protein M436DRAFT_81564 [Aureobasidium namibiae CBS 147.97]|uniref:Aminoglycoside phosphotransferase domain-containing protein n=1 Tax=Aureobasidium namibiae CBS 147.97 TaxID=1043004 RepID=A0A074WNN0_9PEZI|nr:uncharacterized protein M436DRAFT_81564 [Aureobasidium namibiae CBS 147.97]KEQ73169.1 hypothetical protein M436DRAFT_81564 [Aureobasidium namibiae CBS 147.97]